MSSQISISEAARRWNKSRQTLYRKIDSGELSVTGRGKNRKINVSELIRVFGDVTKDSPSNSEVDSLLQSNVTVLRHENDLLKAEIDSLKTQLSIREEQISDIRNQVRLLEYQKVKSDESQPNRPWWKRLIS